MKKSVYYFMTLFALVFSLSALTSCREEKSAGEKIEEGVEDVGDGIEDAADDVGDGIEDAADDVEDAIDDN